MKLLSILFVVLAVGAACLFIGYRVGIKRSTPKPSYLAVSLVTDRYLNSVTAVVEDDQGRYVAQGDEISFLSRGPETLFSTLRPFALVFQKYDFSSLTHPRGANRGFHRGVREESDLYCPRREDSEDRYSRAHESTMKTEANQALQHNDPSCHGSCLRTPRASRGRG
jgi:hypothetical protein